MRQLKTTHGHLMPCSSICIMNLPTIFAGESMLATWHRNGLVYTDSMLIDGHQSWHLANVVACIGTGQIPTYQDRQGENIMPKLYAAAYI